MPNRYYTNRLRQFIMIDTWVQALVPFKKKSTRGKKNTSFNWARIFVLYVVLLQIITFFLEGENTFVNVWLFCPYPISRYTLKRFCSISIKRHINLWRLLVVCVFVSTCFDTTKTVVWLLFSFLFSIVSINV